MDNIIDKMNKLQFEKTTIYSYNGTDIIDNIFIIENNVIENNVIENNVIENNVIENNVIENIYMIEN